MPTEDMDLDEIEKLLAQPDKTRSTATRKASTDDRSIIGWFKLPHTVGNPDDPDSRGCQVPAHDEEARPRNMGMVTIIDGVAVCRVCFLAQLDKQ